MFSFSKIKKELNHIFKKSSVISEISRLKKELTGFEVYKKIKKPTQKHLNQLEKQYRNFSSKMTQKQTEIDKEFKKAVNLLKKRKEEAEAHVHNLQKMAIEKKKSIEKIIQDQMKIFGFKSNKKTNKKAARKKTRTARKKTRTARKKTTPKKAS